MPRHQAKQMNALSFCTQPTVPEDEQAEHGFCNGRTFWCSTATVLASPISLDFHPVCQFPQCLCGWISIITSNDSCEVGLFCLATVRSRWIGSIQWGDLLAAELSGCPNSWGRPRRGDAVDFVLDWSLNEIRHIGQVVCFCNHTSIHSRWKLCRHVGIIRSISLSLYSPKHIEHWASSFEWKASEL